MMNTIQVILADDHALVRSGIRALLEKIKGIEIIAEASDGRMALELIQTKKPDIAILDISMPGLNGVELTKRITQELPDVRVIMLSMHATEDYVRRALRSGAHAYLIKDAATAELELAINSVMNDNRYISPSIANFIVEGYMNNNTEEIHPSRELTSRQREILQLIAEGNTTKEIAQILNLSPKTIESHRARLMECANVHDIAGLVRYAIRLGIVSSD